MKSSVSISRNGRSIRATGAAAQALFLAMTQGMDAPKAEAPAAEATLDPTPAPAEPPLIQIGPLDV